MKKTALCGATTAASAPDLTTSEKARAGVGGFEVTNATAAIPAAPQTGAVTASEVSSSGQANETAKTADTAGHVTCLALSPPHAPSCS